MSDHTPTSPRRYISGWLAAALLLFLAEYCEPLSAQEVPIIVSRETTYITQPLGRDGLPDYEQFLLRKYGEGVTSENNAAVLLCQIMWPGDLDPPQYGPMVKELGLKEIPSGKHSLQSVGDKEFSAPIISWLKAEHKTSGEENSISDDAYAEQADLIVDRATCRPWTSDEIPPLAKWIKESQPALDLAVEASRRPRYFSPSPSYLDDERTTLVAVLLPDHLAVRNVGQYLSMRAMQYLGEGRPEKAWGDLLAIYRLARLIKQGPTLIHQIGAIALNDIASQGTIALLGSHDVDKQLAGRVQEDLAELGPVSSMIDSMDHMERLTALDAVLQMRSQGPSFFTGERKESSPDELLQFRSAIDWNIVLEDINRYYDRYIAAARIPGRPERAQKLTQFDNEMTAAAAGLPKITSIISSAIDIRTRSHSVADTFTCLMLPGTGGSLETEDRGNTEIDLLRLAAALAVYRAEHGTYPESLDALVPDVVAELPVDLYNEKTFIYKRDGEGYLLYSAGPNGRDDGGSHNKWDIFAGYELHSEDDPETNKLRTQIPVGADDIAIRVPVPPFKQPEPREVPPEQ